MKSVNYIYSKTFDHFLILPMKTGSVSACWILTYFDFHTHTRNFLDDSTFKEFTNPAISPVHSFYLPPEKKNPKIIVTTRNPYEKTLSRFLFTWNHRGPNPTPLDFEIYLANLIKHQNPIATFPDEVIATHVIHLENLYEDYIKIPFIKESNLNKSGILKEFTEKKINETHLKVDREKYLTEKNKELIYNFLENQFKLFGYEK